MKSLNWWPKASRKHKLLFNLKGKYACVTGASSGLGAYAAQFLVEQSVAVVGVARCAEKLAVIQEDTDGLMVTVLTDLSQLEALPDIAQQVT